MKRDDLIDEVSRELWKLDGTTLAAVALLTGFSVEAIRDLGGVE